MQTPPSTIKHYLLWWRDVPRAFQWWHMWQQKKDDVALVDFFSSSLPFLSPFLGKVHKLPSICFLYTTWSSSFWFPSILFFFYLFQVIFCYQFQPHHLISFSFCFKFDPQSSNFYQFVFLSFVGWFFCFQFQTLSFNFIFYFKYDPYFLIVVYFIFILFLIHFFYSIPQY